MSSNDRNREIFEKFRKSDYEIWFCRKYLLRADHMAETSDASSKKNVKYELVREP